MQSQMDLQAGMRANKQKLQKGKLIVTDVRAAQAVKAGNYSLHNGLLYHTGHTGEALVCVPDDSLKHGMPALRNKLMTEVHKGLTMLPRLGTSLRSRSISASYDIRAAPTHVQRSAGMAKRRTIPSADL
jgi:hypothetical protein